MLSLTVVTAAALFSFVIYLSYSCVRQTRAVQQLEQQLSDKNQRLLTSEQRYDFLFSANPYPMWVQDTQTLRFLGVNDATVRCYGYSREEFLGMTLLDIRPPEDAGKLMEMLRERKNGCNRRGVIRHTKKDGTKFFVEIVAFSFPSDHQSAELVLALDVTERCRIEQALLESEASLKALVNDAPFGIAQSAIEQDRLTTLNPELLRMLGYELDEALRLSVGRQVYADPKERDRLIEVLRRSGKIHGWETNFRRKNGSLVPVRITATLSDGTNGIPALFSTYIEDMTQQSALEQQVRQVQKLEAVGRLAGGMAHDFNNILVVIKLCTDMLLSEITPESPFSKSLLQIASAADRAAALTRQMLAFGRQQLMQPRIINLNTVVGDTSRMLRRVIGEDIQLVTALGEQVGNTKLDPDQLTQVILNLAVNARDAMPNGGELEIATANAEIDEAYAKEHPPANPGSYVMLSVADTGTGILSSVLPHIFDPFFTTKDIGRGTGLGLSIVYGIVKQSGGYIWVESQAGQGTVFKLYFPVVAAPVEGPVIQPMPDFRPCGETILLVEDDATIRGNLRDCLENLGYRVLEAASASEGLSRCVEVNGKIDLMLTDLVMPGKSGHALARDLTERFPAVRVLFMSGYTEDSAVRREIMLQSRPFLQKPFSVTELANAVHTALALRVSAGC